MTDNDCEWDCGPSCPGNHTSVTYYNVGQGDCSVFESADRSWRALVDGGIATQGSVHYAHLRSRSPYDLLVATHYYEDHIGGLIGYVRRAGRRAAL